MSDETPAAVPTDTLIAHNRISDTFNGVFTDGDYTRIAQNRIIQGQGTSSTGIRVGLPGGRVAIGTEILANVVERFTVGISLQAAEDSFVAQNRVRRNRNGGVSVLRDNNIIAENRITDTVGIGEGGLTISSVGNLIIRNVLERNRPFDLTVASPAENDLVENRCQRSSPPNLCNRGPARRRRGRF